MRSVKRKQQQRRRGWARWGTGGVALLAVALFISQVLAASMPLTSQPLQNTGTNNSLKHSPDWTSASAITQHVTVTLKDGAAGTLDSGSGLLPSAAGTYSTAVTMTGPVVAYSSIADVATVYAAAGGVPIVFDAFSSIATGGKATNHTWSHTVGAAGTNRILVVGTSAESAVAVTGVTYAAQALTKIGAQASLDGATAATELWYLIAPPTGPNDIVVTLSANKKLAAGATSWTGVHQTTPLGTAVFAPGNSLSASVDVTSATGEVVVDALANKSSTSRTVGADQTQHWSVNSGGKPSSAGSSEAGAGTVTMSWTHGVAVEWALGAVPLKQASP